ncbi:glycosyltransferase family 8 protein [Lactiplantibacillus garii]|uniref:Glycosyltransferase family 8 protein n=1 Tax=Lactiplantibacillus garii TaxID=2306423 RepID=A0A3R8J6B1_9LACO|nr:glycosyltransferase family 8 protein [Lactiplantibacillus garii]RRK09651.1 glycosyltransferase family 8 protein [Lactiplantibacillus garii]
MATPIDILVTLDAGYVPPLKVMLWSLHANNLKRSFHVWLVHESLTDAQVAEVRALTDGLGWELTALPVEVDLTDQPALIKRYPPAMYFRLLCGQVLPADVHRVIYLDPDILVINDVTPLWELDLQGNMLAAAAHRGVTKLVDSVNQIRLGTNTSYFNSGVLVIDVDQARRNIHLNDITAAIAAYHDYLILPDQDILNFLYGESILEIDEEVWNYDTRKYLVYQTRTLTEHDIHWVMSHTVLLHYCGTPKPWEANSDSKFTGLFLNYQQQVQRFLSVPAPTEA